MSERDAARLASARAGALIDERRFCEALEPAADACRLTPDSPDAWSDYAIALKHGHCWSDCLDACDRIIALDSRCDIGVHWNAGIAATALGNWSRARAAWTAVGARVPSGDGPIEMELGLGAVRIALDGQPEVVFGTRLDPCRIELASVPLPESGHRYGDIVLHDGEPRGKRAVGDGQVTVFDELLRLRPSIYGTWVVRATCRDPEDRDALVAMFDGVDGAMEDWTASVVAICEQCSLGEAHDHEENQGWSVERTLGLALRNDRDLGRLRRL